MPVRIQRQRTRGWRMPPNTVYVGRPTKWGNPFSVDEFGRTRCIALYRDALEGFWDARRHFSDTEVDLANHAYALWCEFTKRHNGTPSKNACAELYGVNLSDWCALDQSCHVDVLLEIANKGPS